LNWKLDTFNNNRELMANNDKLNRIATNVNTLGELAQSMMKAEIFPVSFFSQAFDLLQRIQSDFHTLEADQVEMFASQMEKHRELIMSVHKQMLTIQPTSGRPLAETEPEQVTEAPEQTAEATLTAEATPLSAEQLLPPEIPVIPQENLPETTTETDNDDEEFANFDEEPEPAATVPAPQPEVEPETPQQPQPQPQQQSYAGDNIAHPSFNDLLEKKKLSDLRRAFSLNDVFRYRRELFGGKEELMNSVIGVLNKKQSLKESIAFIEEKLHWDLESPAVKDFIKVLEKRYL